MHGRDVEVHAEVEVGIVAQNQAVFLQFQYQENLLRPMSGAPQSLRTKKKVEVRPEIANWMLEKSEPLHPLREILAFR